MLDTPSGTESDVALSVGAGLAMQVDITTRLAATLRGGAMLWPNNATLLRETITPALTLGIAVY